AGADREAPETARHVRDDLAAAAPKHGQERRGEERRPGDGGTVHALHGAGSRAPSDASLPAMPALLSRTSTGASSAPANAAKVSGRSRWRRTTFGPARAASVAVAGSRTAATTSSPRARS